MNTVSASFGSQIARSAMWAVVFSLLLVVGYIWIRFQWKFAIATIAALLHDVLIAIGIYSLFGLEVSTATVAAILTVLGYSIYDSIIILDRVRENIPLMRRASFREIGNVSLWETIRRSLATTFITLLPIGALYFFGGDTLKDFAFALLIGIGSGAYSSIFLAVPLLSWLKEREPEYAKRKETDVPEDDLLVAEEAMHAAAEEPVPELALLATVGPTVPATGRRQNANAGVSGARRVPMAEPVSAARNVVEALVGWARDETGKVGERASDNMSAVLRELGFVTQSEHEDLELRVAQLEHRIRLLESTPPPVTLDGDGADDQQEPRPAL